MNKQIFPVLLLVLLAGCKETTINEEQSKTCFKTIESLIDKKDFFAARDHYNDCRQKMNEYHQLVSGALVDHAFNRLDSSNQKIGRLLQEYGTDLSDSLRYKLLVAKQINHGKRYEYEEAYQAINEIINTLDDQIPAVEKNDFLNARIIWKTLSGQPGQAVTVAGTTTLKIKHDKAGLANLTVGTGADSLDFIFDTGANFSTVTASTAKRFNMVMMDSVIDVRAITGTMVKSGIAVCPEFHMGNIKIKNAVFLVFADSALAVPKIGYQINGIIGFPVIEAMKEIQITRAGEFIVPQQRTAYEHSNMALDFLTPVLVLNGDSYTFDTGANKTILYSAYFRKHKKDIESIYQEREVDLGGAGGSVNRKVYSITFIPVIDDKPVRIDSVMVLEENMAEELEYFYGNIGQDLIKKFDRMTLNFEAMFIRFD